jgi:sulfur-carrier protein
MKVTVRAFAQLRDLLAKETDVEVAPGESVRGLIAVLARSCPGLEDALCERGELKSLYTIMKNGRNLAFLDGMETVLDAGDVLSIFPPAGGG